MALTRHYESPRLGYEHICRMVAAETTRDCYPDHIVRAPRGRTTRELEDVQLVFHDPTDCLVLGFGRQLNTRIAAAEAWQLIGGFSDPEWLIGIAPQFAAYADVSLKDGERYFHGAYGHRVGFQLEDVVAKLKSDADTRRAVITLWDPDLDYTIEKRDYPCTVAIGFSLVRDHLNMRVTMRSNDVWLGLPYDVFQFAQLQLTLAQALEVHVGTYTHTAWSLHLYADDAPKIEQLRQFNPLTLNFFVPRGFGRPGDDVVDTVGFAERMHYGPWPLTRELTESEAWYAQRNEA